MRINWKFNFNFEILVIKELRAFLHDFRQKKKKKKKKKTKRKKNVVKFQVEFKDTIFLKNRHFIIQERFNKLI